MAIVRILVLAAVLVIIGALLAYVVTGQRKYLQFALRLFKLMLGVILTFMLLLATERAIDMWRN